MKLIFSTIITALIFIYIWFHNQTSISSESNFPSVEHKLAQLLAGDQKLSYIDFWASWCTPCLKSFPALKQAQQKFSEQGFTVISINLDANKKNAENFLAQQQVNFPVLFDPTGNLATKYKVQGMPTGLLINNQGELIWQHQGFKVGDKQLLLNKLNELLAE